MSALTNGELERCTVSLDVYLFTRCDTTDVQYQLYDANITHNCRHMADAAGLYLPLWHPAQRDDPTNTHMHRAATLIGPIYVGLENLIRNSATIRLLENEDGWGTYDQFIRFVREYLDALLTYPESYAYASR